MVGRTQGRLAQPTNSVDLHQPPAFGDRNLGGDAVPGRAYCGHHWRMARGYPVRAITAGETRYRAFSRSISEL